MNVRVLATRVHPGAAAVLAVLTLSASLLIGGLPRAVQGAYDAALHDVMNGSPATRTDLIVTQTPQTAEETIPTADGFSSADRRWWGLLSPELRAVAESGPASRTHYSAKTEQTPVSGRAGPGHQNYQFVNIGWLSDAERRVRYVEGKPPAAVTSLRQTGKPEIPCFDIALTKEASQRMDLPVGTVLLLGHSDVVAARVTGIFEPLRPADRYWDHNRDLLQVRIQAQPGADNNETHITGLTSAATLPKLNGDSRQLSYRWIIPVGSEKLNARNADGVIDATEAFTDAAGTLVIGRSVDQGALPGGGSPGRATTGLGTLLGDFLLRLGNAESLLLLILGGLTAVALGVIALGVQLLTDRLRPTLGLMRARGASLGQVVGTGAGVVALVSVPAALAGYGLSYLVPGPVTASAHLGPVALAVTAVLFAAGRVAVTHRTPLHDRRDDMVARRPSPRRLTVEIVVIALALGGAYLLRTRGLTTSVAERGADPFLMAVPVALTVACALITVRCYPYPLRLIASLATRRPRAVPFLGLTLAARARSFSALPVLILLPALTVSVFASVIAGGLTATQRDAAWQRAGAHARIESTVAIPPDAVERVRRTAGVRDVIPAAKGSVQIGRGSVFGTGFAVDLNAYRRILAGTPLSMPAAPPDSPGPDVPALVSPELAGNSTLQIGWSARFSVAPKGTITTLPGLTGKPRGLIVVPLDANERAGTRTEINTLLISGSGLDPARLAAAANLSVPPIVTTVDDELRKITSTPLAGTVQTTLLVVTLALAAYALLAVLIVLVITGADRDTALTYLRTLGMSERQARGLTVLEITPMIVLTALAGLLLGLALPAALGPGIDLSVYAGNAQIDGYPIDVLTPVLLTAGLAAVAVAGAFAHAAVARRRALGGALRVGTD
ncbi:FtsX-like permease family protein [Spongiactinospora sp. TRM90649]|uniref:FtsX-like permease family protein n=1 Tax=Spongiactinospora sp. TRM90649 TaxID=3031114 RepID=UPI0023F99B27|nr:FtsX-like permease family protein [Spongiactinospora sp. TRM90649]MDF5754097.1 hypothetical protein [Spongiactinospora sp. TRM90649]